MSLHRGAREVLFNTQAYDYFRLSNRNAKELTRDFVRFVTDLSPDLVHFHHFIGLGMESLYALREALPSIRIVVTFHEFLSICHHHGQMVKTGSSRLCYRSSPAECAGCFPEIAPAQFYKRERFIKTFLELADLYISPSQFLLERYVDWGLPRESSAASRTASTRPWWRRRGPACRRRRAPQPLRLFRPDQRVQGAGCGARRDRARAGDPGARIALPGLRQHPRKPAPGLPARLRRTGRALRPPRALLGSYRPSDLPRLMRNIDWVIVPSNWWENSPVVIQEAFRTGGR